MHQADRGGDVVHVALETQFLYVVLPGIALALGAIPGAAANPQPGEPTQPGGGGLVARSDHAPVAGGQVLHRVEAETAKVPQRAQGLPKVLAATTVGHILNHLEAVVAGDGQDGFHVAAMAAIVDHDNRLCAWRHFALDILGVNVQSIGLDVGKDGNAVAVEDGVIGGYEGHGGGDHLSTFDASHYE